MLITSFSSTQASDDVGGGKACLGIAFAHLVPGHHVVGALNDRGARFKGVERIVDARQWFQIEFDQLQRPLGDHQRLGRHQRHGLPVVANSIVNQDRLIGGEAFSPGLASDVRGRQTTRQLLAGEHAGDAGQPARFGYVDAAQARAGERAPQHLCVEHVWHHMVPRVAGLAMGLAWHGTCLARRCEEASFRPGGTRRWRRGANR
jgi:hypothetical protein